MTDFETFASLVFNYATYKIERLKKRNLKLVHYTTADTALKIIINRDMWLRNASNMNDYMEVQHGSACLKAAIKGYGGRFAAALQPLGEDFSRSIMLALDASDYNARFHTYILSLSEHRADDVVGRLSMWRAYGGPVAGVALVFNPIFIDFDSTDLAVWSSPVLYGDEKRFTAEFLRIVENLEANQELLVRVGPELVRNTLINALQFAILSSKHGGFKEEREWRLIHMPRDTASALVQPTFESVGGAPEQVYHLPLQDPFNSPLRPDYNIDKLLHCVIVGPCRNEVLIRETIQEALTQVGVQNSVDRIHLSLIPLRQQG